MTQRKRSASILNVRRLAAAVMAATLLFAAGVGADRAKAQQPPAATPPSTTPRPPRAAAPKAAAPAAAAQKPPAAPPATQAAAPPGAPELPPLIYSPWTKVCSKGNDGKEVCFTGKDGRLESGQPVVQAVLIEPEGANKLFRVTLPTGVSLQHGSRIVIDNKDPLTAPFMVCLAYGCMADLQVTPDLITKLKTGQVLTIQAVNMGGNAFGLPLPLSDNSGNSFIKANEGPPTDPKIVEEQQKKLQEELQKRADEARKKLEAQGGTPPK
jgi:invasion protein IalB